ncbi:MAG TPA: tetratricopeptide repeat protein [Vicinamibacterales bacterium]|nr:tetratricopeptide repeat protein [Vicinamibacterales bacterium]
MKRIERHKLKENEFARTVERARQTIAERQREVTIATVAVIVILIAFGAYSTWRSSRASRANNLLASALAVAEAPVVTPPPPAPGSPPPVQQPGTYRTEAARAEAALPKLMDVADRYPNTDAGITARYRAAATLAELGRLSEAEQRYQEVIGEAGASSLYGRTARLGLADVQVAQKKYDAAITTLRELSTDTDSQLPLDGVLMELGRAYARAGKADEAKRAFTRVTDEFPQSLYASEARDQIATLKKG